METTISSLTKETHSLVNISQLCTVHVQYINYNTCIQYVQCIQWNTHVQYMYSVLIIKSFIRFIYTNVCYRERLCAFQFYTSVSQFLNVHVAGSSVHTVINSIHLPPLHHAIDQWIAQDLQYTPLSRLYTCTCIYSKSNTRSLLQDVQLPSLY